MQQIDVLIEQLLADLAPVYGDHATDQMSKRVVDEHFAGELGRVRLKRGDVANITETCDPTNPHQITCPQGQTVALELVVGKSGRDRYWAHFAAAVGEACPLLARCLTRPLTRWPQRYFSVDANDRKIARRRQWITADRHAGPNLRVAIESTIGALKQP